MKGVKISVEPNPVEQNEAVTITVSVPGGGSTGWFMRIVAAHDSAVVKCEARGLGAYGNPRPGDPNTHDCKIQTIGFEPGEYLVDVSPMTSFELPDTASKKFTVEAQMPIVVSANLSSPNSGFMRPGYRHSRI